MELIGQALKDISPTEITKTKNTLVSLIKMILLFAGSRTFSGNLYRTIRKLILWNLALLLLEMYLEEPMQQKQKKVHTYIKLFVFSLFK